MKSQFIQKTTKYFTYFNFILVSSIGNIQVISSLGLLTVCVASMHSCAIYCNVVPSIAQWYYNIFLYDISM